MKGFGLELGFLDGQELEMGCRTVLRVAAVVLSMSQRALRLVKSWTVEFRVSGLGSRAGV